MNMLEPIVVNDTAVNTGRPALDSHARMPSLGHGTVMSYGFAVFATGVAFAVREYIGFRIGDQPVIILFIIPIIISATPPAIIRKFFIRHILNKCPPF